ncbi:hypothetical protein EHQ46_08040 [Leptospira yanagawae]|uniref:Uncharacterized protein n=1 Tax=Leptospira yanagawae TaxID=293069 RepID=A0ABY2M642_9LEPT|nr:hypothetical protein [Leptospira yanagawae]TGL21790.1 hypothetical protein EHQ46_08040 [Leptospira yanagawae]
MNQIPDPNTKQNGNGKQIFVGFLFLLLPVILYSYVGIGATLKCQNQICELERKGFFHRSQTSFSISDILRIGYNSDGASLVRTGPSSIGVSGTDLEIHFKNGTSTRVFGTPIGYQFGNLDFRELDALVSQPNKISIELSSYSFGGKLLFIGPTMVFIGYILILMQLVRPVTADLLPAVLQKNRIYNLFVFLTSFSFVIVLYSLLWHLGKSKLI